MGVYPFKKSKKEWNLKKQKERKNYHFYRFFVPLKSAIFAKKREIVFSLFEFSPLNKTRNGPKTALLAKKSARSSILKNIFQKSDHFLQLFWAILKKVSPAFQSSCPLFQSSVGNFENRDQNFIIFETSKNHVSSLF